MALPLIDKEPDLRKAENILRALNHPLRKRILQLLDEKQLIKVTDIYVYFRIEQSVASQHLRILREANIVEALRSGKNILYKPNYDKLAKLEKVVSEIVSD